MAASLEREATVLAQIKKYEVSEHDFRSNEIRELDGEEFDSLELTVERMRK